MDIREKLVELLMQVSDNMCDDCGREPVGCAVVAIADYLIANGVTVQEWIPVSERLPTESGTYLVACSEGRVGWHFYYNAFPDRVTHWMPLPEPPKGG